MRDLRKWLADPAVSDEVRVGDAELVVLLPEHLLERDEVGASLYKNKGIERWESRTRQTLHWGGGQWDHRALAIPTGNLTQVG
jgi:hypothetical protein